jgi:hypothetical protein
MNKYTVNNSQPNGTDIKDSIIPRKLRSGNSYLGNGLINPNEKLLPGSPTILHRNGLQPVAASGS